MNSDRTSKNDRTPSAHRRSSKIILALILAAALLLVVWGISAIAGYFATVKRIEVIGESPYSEDTILAIAGIEQNARRSKLNLDESEKNILAELSYISKVKISCSLFGKVKINITSDMAVFATTIADNLLVMSEDFRILDIKDADSQIDGMIEIVLPKIKFAFEGREVVFYENIDFFGELLKTLDDSFVSGRVNYIYAVDRYDVEIRFDEKYTVKFGELGDMDVKLRLAENMLNSFTENAAQGAIMDVSDPSSPSVRPIF